MQIKPYDPRIVTINATHNPTGIVAMAAHNTQLAPRSTLLAAPANHNSALIKYLVEAGHTSVLEHAHITFVIDQISRGCADQLRTHRMGSWTVSSTHYNKHEDVTYYMDIMSCGNPAIIEQLIQHHELYIKERERIGAEARQMLPLATETRLMWTVNARALLNFFRVRLCERNMQEMVMCAYRILEQAKEWFPELFCLPYVGPDCEYIGCTQGSMACKKRS